MIAERNPTVHLKIDRGRSLGKAFLWMPLTGLTGLLAYLICRDLPFTTTGTSNRLVEYAIALIALPLPVLSAWSAWKALQWLTFTLWPGTLEIQASERGLVLQLGPFGTRRFDAARLVVKYPFELSADLDGGGFEAFLPEERQRSTLLPGILHPDSPKPLNHEILRFSSLDETRVAGTLRACIAVWRGETDGLS